MSDFFEMASALISNQVHKAILVKIENVLSFIDNDHMRFADLISLNPAVYPVYDSLWLEYSTTCETIGWLCRQQTRSETKSMLLTRFALDQNTQSLSFPSKYQIYIAPENTITKDQKGMMIFKQAGNSPDLNLLTVPLFTLSLMRCKNITLEKIPDTRYHNLLIFPIAGRDRQAQMTIRRGHFKDYRQGRGLFGKHHDLYWWEIA